MVYPLIHIYNNLQRSIVLPIYLRSELYKYLLIGIRCKLSSLFTLERSPCQEDHYSCTKSWVKIIVMLQVFLVSFHYKTRVSGTP